jgi:3-oxoadipate CoA-transferase beta subunit
MTEHLTKNGACKIVKACTYPLTGMACIDRIYTDMAVMDITDRGVVVRELFGDITADYLQSVTPVALTFALQTDDATA